MLNGVKDKDGKLVGKISETTAEYTYVAAVRYGTIASD